MDNFKFLTTDNRRLVIFRNLTVGEIAQCDDGEYVFFPEQQRTCFIRLWMLEEIAGELKRLNYGIGVTA